MNTIKFELVFFSFLVAIWKIYVIIVECSNENNIRIFQQKNHYCPSLIFLQCKKQYIKLHIEVFLSVFL